MHDAQVQACCFFLPLSSAILTIFQFWTCFSHVLCFLSQICQKFPLAEGECYSDGRDIFKAEHAEKALFHHLSQASHKGLTGAHMGKDRPGASTWIDLFQELWVNLELISPTNSPQAEKALPHQAGVLEVPGSASSDCLIDITVPLCRGRRGKTKRKRRRYWKLEKVWFLHKAAASCWTPWKGNSWQHPLPIAAGAGTVSHSGHC